MLDCVGASAQNSLWWPKAAPELGTCLLLLAGFLRGVYGAKIQTESFPDAIVSLELPQ